MDIRAAGFEWDDANRDKCRKHGISLAAVESIFRGSIAIFPDPTHSRGEARFIAIGRTGAGRHVFIAFTLRLREDATFIRPISARYMHKKEVKHYEEIAKAQNR